MRPIVTDRVVWSVCPYVTLGSPEKTAEPIEMPFGIGTRGRARQHVLGRGAQRRHLVNTNALSMCGGDAAFCQITLTTC